MNRDLIWALAVVLLGAGCGGEARKSDQSHPPAPSGKSGLAAEQLFLVESGYEKFVPLSAVKKRNEGILLAELNPAQAQSVSDKIGREAPFCGGMVAADDEVNKDENLLSNTNYCLNICNASDCRLPENPAEPRFPQEVKDIADVVGETQLFSMVTQISSLGERRYRKPGRGGADEVFAILQRMVPPGRSVSIDKVRNDPNPDEQYSIVVKIPTTTTPSKPGVLVGAHLDSFSSDDTAPAPGADDDATGVATVIEMFRALMTARGGALRFNRDIYFVLYSGEEVGLFGSETVADSFCRGGVRLRGVMQLDMTGYDVHSGRVFFVKGTSAVDPLLSFTSGIASSYFGFPSGETQCPTILSNCSDHVSWKKRGYRAVFPFESKIKSFNGNIHSKDDLPAHLSPAHVMRFFKIAVAFVVELGEPA